MIYLGKDQVGVHSLADAKTYDVIDCGTSGNLTPTGDLIQSNITIETNGTYFAPSGTGYSKVVAAIHDQNPNSMITVNGTLSNPFGNLDIEELFNNYINHNVSLILEADMSSMNAGTMTFFPQFCIPSEELFDENTEPYHYYDFTFVFINNISNGSSNCIALQYLYNEDNLGLLGFISAHSLYGGNYIDMQIAIKDFPTTLTIIYHPLTGTLPAAESQTFGGEQ